VKIATTGIVLGILAGLTLGNVKARDLGQWENSDPAVREWYKGLMQPDVPTLSCCGEADSYWCDDIFVRGEKTYCRITDDRPDEPLKRQHRAIGEEYEIPPNKLVQREVNPTGHSIIFLSSAGYTWCFVMNGGV
jgi:hypothetical protein